MCLVLLYFLPPFAIWIDLTRCSRPGKGRWEELGLFGAAFVTSDVLAKGGFRCGLSACWFHGGMQFEGFPVANIEQDVEKP